MEASGIEPVSAWNRSPNPKYETSTLLTPPLAAWFHPSASWTKGREVDGNTNLMDGDGAATVRFSVNAGIWHGECPSACGDRALWHGFSLIDLGRTCTAAVKTTM